MLMMSSTYFHQLLFAYLLVLPYIIFLFKEINTSASTKAVFLMIITVAQLCVYICLLQIHYFTVLINKWMSLKCKKILHYKSLHCVTPMMHTQWVSVSLKFLSTLSIYYNPIIIIIHYFHLDVSSCIDPYQCSSHPIITYLFGYGY